MITKLYEQARERLARMKRQEAAPDPAGVTVPAWLVRAAHFASVVAMCSLIYFLWLYTLDIARDRSGAMHVTHAGTWVGDMRFWFPYIVGFAIIAFGIPYVAKIAIPTFMSLSWSGGFWPKLWALIIAASVSLVVISGTFAVQGDTLLERDRESAVAVEQVQQGRAALEAQIESRRAELTDMMGNRNAYLAQAASVGEVEWQRSYVAQARQTRDERLPMIERALGAARAADALRADLTRLRGQLAAAPAVASVQGEVTTARTSWIADTLGWLEGVRAILLSLVMDIVALMMPWIALRLEQARARQMGVGGSGWADEAHRIEDLRDQPPVTVQRDAKGRVVMEQPRETVTDHDTGEELVKIRPREYWRKRVPKKGKPTLVEITPDIPPDEPGVDGYATGRVPLPDGEGVMIESQEPVADQRSDEDADSDAQPEADEPDSLELTAAELAMLESELTFENDSDDHEDGESGDGDDNPDHLGQIASPPEQAPETRAERLIAAE